MPKDTKSSGYNKAPACESRGFGHKKEGENFDTPSFLVCYVKPDCLFIAVARFLLCAVGFGSGDQSEAPFVFPVCR